MRKMSDTIKMIANQLCWSTAIMTSMTKKVFQNSNKGKPLIHDTLQLFLTQV